MPIKNRHATRRVDSTSAPIGAGNPARTARELSAPVTALALPDADPAVQAIKASATQSAARAGALVIRDEDSAALATAALADLRKAREAVDALRLRFVKPLKDRARQIDDFFAQIRLPLERIDEALRAKVVTWRESVEREARAKREAAEAEAQRLAAEAAAKRCAADGAVNARSAAQLVRAAEKIEADAATAATAALHAAPEPPKAIGAVAFRHVWDYTIVDAAKVPIEYRMIDETKIRAAVRAGLREIPGVRIYQRPQIAVRG